MLQRRKAFRVTTARQAIVLSAVLLLPSCGGDRTAPGDDPPDPPPPPADASVTVLDGSAVRPNPFQQSVTLHLRNDGGPGVYKVEVWGYPTTPNGADILMGTTEPVEVAEGYEETLTYDVGVDTFARYALVFTRNPSTAAYHQTDRFDFP